MKLEIAEKKSLFYAIFSAYVGFLHNKIFYKKVVYTGTENIPHDKPVVFAPNHQNALMDALAVFYAQDRLLIFLARSDIFKNNFISKILLFFRILPVYRLRDGKEKLKLNEVIYKKTIEILEKKKKVTIFPEAQHTDKRHLKKLKKGVQRIAFMTEEKNNFNADVNIVPIGIYYSNYWNFRSVLQVNFGKPIKVSEYIEEYKKSPARAMVNLGKKMSEKMQEVMIDIRDLKHYDTYELLREIYDTEIFKKMNFKKNNQKNKFKADKKTISIVENIAKKNPDDFAKLHKDTEEYSENLKKFKIRDWVIEKSEPFTILFLKAIVLIIGIPVFIYGALNNIIPYLLPQLITRKLEDQQFRSSVVFCLGLFTFPLFYLIFFIPVYILSGSFLIGIIYLLSLLPTGLLAFVISRNFVKLKAQFVFLKNINKKEMKKTIELRKNIIKIIDKHYIS